MSTVSLKTPATHQPTNRLRFGRFYLAVVIIQGIHVIEHIIQLIQVHVLGVADDDAFGVLGYLIQFNGTEEWLHFAFNLSYLLSLFAIMLVLYELMVDGALARWAFVTYVVLGVGLEAWHMTEHIVIIANVMQNGGCPCPGIGDRALNVTDTNLHFVYNTIAYAATIVPFLAWRGRLALWRPARVGRGA